MVDTRSRQSRSAATRAPSIRGGFGLALFTLRRGYERDWVWQRPEIIVALIGLLVRPQHCGSRRHSGGRWPSLPGPLLTAPWAIEPEIAQSTAVERLKVFVVFWW